MKTVASTFKKLARSMGVGVRVRVRVVRKSDGWTVDLSDHCGVDWITGLDYAENLDASTVDFRSGTPMTFEVMLPATYVLQPIGDTYTLCRS